MAKQRTPLPIMERVLDLFERSGKSLEELGLGMGYPAESARKSAWQFLRKTDDPRVSMLQRFAKAMGIDVKELL
jgi:transcriptional regulator with XRE-family HTH domain